MALGLTLLLVQALQASPDFKSLVQQTLKQDPEFANVDFQTSVVEAQKWQGLSNLIIPRINFNFGEYEQKNNVSLATAADKFRFGTLSASLDLFNFGSDWNNWQATRRALRAQEARVETQIIRRESEIIDLYLLATREAKNVQILEKLVKMKEEALGLSRKLMERGVLSVQEYQKVQLDVSNSKSELLTAQQRLKNHSAQLQAYGDQPIPTEFPWVGELTESRIQQLFKLEAKTQELPQFKEMMEDYEASRYSARSATGVMFGSFAFNFNRSYYEFPTQELWEWRTSLVYTLPLFDQFDQEVTRRRAVAERKIAELRQSFSEKSANAQMQAQKENLQIAWKNWLERKDALKISQDLYRYTLRQFNSGAISVNELFVDQDRLLRTEQVANEGLYQLHSSTLAFCHSRGKAYSKNCF